MRLPSVRGTEPAWFPPGGVVMRCTHWRRLPLELVREAREQSASGCIDSAERCQLPAHDNDEHYGLLDGLEHGTALWLRWCGTDVALTVLPDCPAVSPGPDKEGCCLFLDHIERHTWVDAEGEVSRIS